LSNTIGPLILLKLLLCWLAWHTGIHFEIKYPWHPRKRGYYMLAQLLAIIPWRHTIIWNQVSDTILVVCSKICFMSPSCLEAFNVYKVEWTSINVKVYKKSLCESCISRTSLVGRILISIFVKVSQAFPFALAGIWMGRFQLWEQFVLFCDQYRYLQ